jgi:hypothetical protein
MLRATRIIGSSLQNPAGEDLGRVEDFVLDHLTGRMAYAIVTLGGIGDKLFAVPHAVLSYRSRESAFMIHVDRDTLRRAPGFDRDQWPDLDNRLWAEEIHAHYGCTPYWE